MSWTWEVKDSRGKWCLCFWAMPSRVQLVTEGKPSPEARPVRVRLVRVPKRKKVK